MRGCQWPPGPCSVGCCGWSRAAHTRNLSPRSPEQESSRQGVGRARLPGGSPPAGLPTGPGDAGCGGAAPGSLRPRVVAVLCALFPCPVGHSSCIQGPLGSPRTVSPRDPQMDYTFRDPTSTGPQARARLSHSSGTTTQSSAALPSCSEPRARAQRPRGTAPGAGGRPQGSQGGPQQEPVPSPTPPHP